MVGIGSCIFWGGKNNKTYWYIWSELQDKQKTQHYDPQPAMINHSRECWQHESGAYPPTAQKKKRSQRAPAATAADKLGRLIASQKLLATLGISGPAGACWGGLSHSEPPHAVTRPLMLCGILRGAGRLPGWRRIVGAPPRIRSWSRSTESRTGRVNVKVKTPKGISHIYSVTLTELISQIKAAASVLSVILP